MRTRLFIIQAIPLFLLMYLFTACDLSTRTVKLKSLSSGEKELSFKVQDNYLLLPIQQNAPEKTVSIYVSDQYHISYQIRLAQDTVDYLMPLDLRRWPKDTPVRMTLVEGNPNAVWMNKVEMSSTFNFDYAEKYRPVYHFTPPYGWMNDPNGMVYLDGEYHLFYQYNPFGTVWGNMHWGHAVSKDLYSWRHKPIALEPDSLGTIFSGCAVIDKFNSAGFGKDAMILFYTADGKQQTQCIAYSTDKGKTFNKYQSNPVIANPGKKDFRDPKVFWYQPEKKWIMIVAAGDEMDFYASENLREWRYKSSFGKNQGAHGGVWECPDLFQLPVNGNDKQMKWVLLSNINPGGVQGGSATQYFVGNFDGTNFVNENDSATIRWMDWGKDNYAAVTWSNVPDNRCVGIGWMSNWEYAQKVPTVIFRSSKTVAREFTLGKYGKETILFSYPAREIINLQSSVNDLNSFDIRNENVITPLIEGNNGSYEFNFLLQPGISKSVSFTLSNKKEEFVKTTFDLAKGILSFDRSHSGIVDFSTDFPVKIEAPLAVNEVYEVRVLVDKSSIEMFIDGGAITMTNLIFPTIPYDILSFSSLKAGARVNELTITRLEESMLKIIDWSLLE